MATSLLGEVWELDQVALGNGQVKSAKTIFYREKVAKLGKRMELVWLGKFMSQAREPLR